MSLLALALGLTTPALGQVRAPTLGDSQEPGSVIVFPKFVRGTVNVDGAATPQTEIEVGVVCPAGPPFLGTCSENQQIKIRFHWVCPANQTFESKLVCRETDFDVTVSINGKAVFSPDGIPFPRDPESRTVTVPAAECDRGYLIGWAINPATDAPMKFDGLIGDAVIRLSDTAVSSYNAIPIQADPGLANLAPIATEPDPLDTTPRLVFDGGPGHYQAVTGRVFGDVKYSDERTGPTFVNTYLTLLTLDVRSNEPNLPTFVGLRFFNETERLVSTSTEFVCWGEVELQTIDANLTRTGMGSRKGLFSSDLAVKKPFAGVFDTAGPVTLLGIVEVIEGPAPKSAARSYATSVANDSVPIPTSFLPNR